MDAWCGEVWRGREVPGPKVSQLSRRYQGHCTSNNPTSQRPQGLSYIPKVEAKASSASVNVSREGCHVFLLVRTSSNVCPKLSEPTGGRSKAEVRFKHADASSICQLAANATAVSKCIFYSEKGCSTS